MNVSLKGTKRSSESFDETFIRFWGSRGLMEESPTLNRKVASSSLGPAGIVGGGSECTAPSPP